MIHKIRKALSYDDVLLVPQQSQVTSRSDAFTTSTLYKNNEPWTHMHPLIASPMSTVCGVDMCIEMDRLNCLGILHRGTPYIDIDNKLKAIKRINESDNVLFGVAIGCKPHDFETALQLADVGVEIICVDVANGHNKIVLDFVNKLKNRLHDVYIIAGNVATAQGFSELAKVGADGVRCGIGGGHSCTTQRNTGVGVPTFQTILDCAQLRDTYYPHTNIIADGGCDNSGDVAKAIAAGADFVMAGSLFAGTSCSPGRTVWFNKITKQIDNHMQVPWSNEDEDTHAWIAVKEYKGMASYDVQIGQGRDKRKIVPEGVSTYVKYKGNTEETVRLLLGGIKSAMSYCNAHTIFDFQSNAEFCEITNNGLMESKPRSVYNLQNEH